jgi:hypothetical protein
MFLSGLNHEFHMLEYETFRLVVNLLFDKFIFSKNAPPLI